MKALAFLLILAAVAQAAPVLEPHLHIPNIFGTTQLEFTRQWMGYTGNGAQFYISCAQVTVTGNGAGTPSPLVAFPGAYKPADRGVW